MGRTLTELEAWVTNEMLVVRQANTESFAEMTRQRFKVYVIEDEEGPAAVVTYMVPDFVHVVLADCFWIRPELRGKTILINNLIKGILLESGRHFAVMQTAQPINDKKRAEGWVKDFPVPDEHVYSHKGMLIYATE